MSQTHWAIEGPEGNGFDLGGLQFSLNENAPPLLCNLVCTSIGRHVHIDYCRGDPHDNPEVLHINEKMDSNPDLARDWVTHSLHWRRMGEPLVETLPLISLMNP